MKIKQLNKALEQLVAEANFSLRQDIIFSLKTACLREKSKLAKKALNWIIKNAQIAKIEKIAICQDTGLPVIFIEIGRNLRISGLIIEEIKKIVELSYQKNYLRRSAVDPLERNKPSYKNSVIYHIDYSPDLEGLRISLLPKGFGCENKSQLKMFNPTVSIERIEDFLVESAIKAGPEACPPFIIGVGIGGTSDTALLMAKKVLLEKINKPNRDLNLGRLEKRVLARINSLGIGPMGLGGRTTCLAVKIKKAPTHIAGLPVGVNISCHALRSASVIINP
ncbi:MAG: fumarate hydratase [Candidatus Omnitrophica bacterium]|nr:fumarate hydratase [Candidatus Omnitrophota bacterium]